MNWTLMNYNLHSGKDAHGTMNLAAMTQVIAAVQPDFAMLEEVACHVTTAGNVDQRAILEEALGMECHFVKAIDWNGGDYGIALLSRRPVSRFQVYQIPDAEESARDRWFEHRVVYRCETLYEDRPVTLMGTHLGLSQRERELGVQTLCEILDDVSTPVILGGDLNTHPHEALLQPLLKRLKIHSTAFTYPALCPEVKIDYLLTSPHWQVQEEYPLPSQASDHLALVKTGLCLA